MKLINLLLLLFTLQLFSCSAPDYPEFRKMENVSLKSVSFKDGLSVSLNGEAVFFNPNLIGANVTEMDFDVFINGKKVTHINQDVSAEMKGNSEFKLPLDFKVPLKEVFKDAKPTLGDIFKKKKIEYKLLGHLKVGLGNIEVSVPVEYEDQEEVRLSK
jgi:LEA14-like dessication related protein